MCPVTAMSSENVSHYRNGPNVKLKLLRKPLQHFPLLTTTMPLTTALKMRIYRERKRNSQTEEEREKQKQKERDKKRNQRKREKRKRNESLNHRKYSIKVALIRGVSGAKDPLIKVAPSLIHNHGVFASVPLIPGDS